MNYLNLGFDGHVRTGGSETVLDDIVWDGYQPTQAEIDTASLKVAKENALQTLRTDYKASLAFITDSYPQVERETWGKQVDEARAYVADNTAPTPFLASQIITRAIPGETITTLSAKIVANDDAYTLASASATGKWQNRQAAVAAATTVAEVEAIKW